MNVRLWHNFQDLWEDSTWFRAATATFAIGASMVAFSNLPGGSMGGSSASATQNAPRHANQLAGQALQLSTDQQRIAQDLCDKLTPEQRLLAELLLKQAQQSAGAAPQP
jgi:Skp family chaperone for outer membrane proteins